MNRAVSGQYCPSIQTVALLPHGISIIRTDCPDNVDWHSNGCKSSAHFALSRIAYGRNNHVVWTVAAVFPYLRLERKPFHFSNTERRLDVLLRHPNGCNLEQFEASRHKWESGQKVLVVWTDVALPTSVRTQYHIIRTDARDLNFIVLNSAQSLLEAHRRSVDSEYNNIPE